MVITQKFLVGISSNFLHSIRASICIRKCNKIFLWYLSHFSEKSMGYSAGYFSKISRFLKMVITRKILVRISSNFLHSIRTSICIRKCNKNWGWFRSLFLEKLKWINHSNTYPLYIIYVIIISKPYSCTCMMNIYLLLLRVFVSCTVCWYSNEDIYFWSYISINNICQHGQIKRWRERGGKGIY